MRCPECREKRGDPEKKCAPEIRGPPYDEQGLQLPELFARHQRVASLKRFQAARRVHFRFGYAQPRQRANVPQCSRCVVDPPRHELPLCRLGVDSEIWQQVFARAEVVQVQHLFAGESALDLGERTRFRPIDQEEAEQKDDRRRRHPQPFVAPPGEYQLALCGCLHSLRGSAACYGHCVSNYRF